MAVSSDYVNFILDQLSDWEVVHTKRMFGCVGLYSDELMFGIIGEDALFLKVDGSNKEKYIEAGSKPFQPFKNRGTANSLYEVPIEVLEDSTLLRQWANESLDIQKNRNRK